MTKTLLVADRLQQLIYDLVRYSAMCDRFCTEQLGITAAQGYTLLAMPDDGSISMNDLSLKIKLASSTMTRMVDQLVLRELVDRQPDAADRRVVRVRLTGHGGNAKLQLQGTLQGVFSQVLQSIPEGESERMLQNLETLNKAIMNTLRSGCRQD
jgi:DNA-binding MarR family transcriptional regulator